MARVVSMTLSCALSGILCFAQQLPSAPEPGRTVQAEGHAASPGKWLGMRPARAAIRSTAPNTCRHPTISPRDWQARMPFWFVQREREYAQDSRCHPGSSLPGLSFRMEEREWWPIIRQRSPAFRGMSNRIVSESTSLPVPAHGDKAIFTGSDDQLFELPLSYWADGHQWINSPGYKDKTANFSRAIYPRCLECHATAIVALSPDPLSNHYDRASLVTGISCETCHGRGGRPCSCSRRGKSRQVPQSSQIFPGQAGGLVRVMS